MSEGTRVEPGVASALRRGAARAWECRGLLLGLWAAGALAGLASAAPWVGAWARALRETGAGHDLGRGFDLMLLGDLLREAGPGMGELRGWALGAGLAAIAVFAVLQGGALSLLLAPRGRRSAALFGEGCGAHARALLALAGVSLLAAALCAGVGAAFRYAAWRVALDAVQSAPAALLRAAGALAAGLLFAGSQVVLELARLERVASGRGGVLESLAAAARTARSRPAACLLIYAAAAAASLAALAPAVALARACGLSGWGWGPGGWAAAQLFLLGRWACRAWLWAGLGYLSGALDDAAD